jgi:hypothetical protein
MTAIPRAIRVIGTPGQVTLRYQINGGPEQTETDVTLPWEKQYPVYNEISTSVSADGGDTAVTCTITTGFVPDGTAAHLQLRLLRIARRAANRLGRTATAPSVPRRAGRPGARAEADVMPNSAEIRPWLVGAPASIRYAPAIPFCLREST